MKKLKKADKLFLKLFLFILNILTVGVVIGISMHFRLEIYLFTLLGAFGWLLLVMPLCFNRWGDWIVAYRLQIKRQYKKKKKKSNRKKRINLLGI